VLATENHNKIGGLYAAVCAALSQELPTPTASVAVNDEYGEVGPQNYLQQRFGLTAANIVATAKELLKKK
jgi:transketolase